MLLLQKHRHLPLLKLRPRLRTTTTQLVLLAIVLLLFGLGNRLNVPIKKSPKEFESNISERSGDMARQQSEHFRDQLTIVTAYFNIGKFKKGRTGQEFTPNTYHEWMRIFSRLRSPLVAFFEDDQDIAYFKKIRGGFPVNLTRIEKVSRDKLWAFGLRDKIAAIFSQPRYPKYYPGTIVPEYSCVMHAKYELMRRVARKNPFGSRYFAWLDIGLFRDITNNEQSFTMHLPPNFDDNKVAYTEVFPRKESLSEMYLFRHCSNWLCGCFFVARRSVMLRWTDDYMRATEQFVRRNYMCSDQQVLYAIANGKRKYSSVDIQTYKSNGKYNVWFNLGYVCAE